MGADEMNSFELTQRNIEEFSRVQSWMLLLDKEAEAYKAMYIRYRELKLILTTTGTNLTEMDVIKG